MFRNKQTGEYPVSRDRIKRENQSIIHPVNFTEASGYDFVIASPQPDYNPETQYVEESPPVLINARWTQKWTIIARSEEDIATRRAEKVISDNTIISTKIESLWSSTDQYIYKYISGVAIGLLTLGVLNSKPKAIAVQSWVNSIWTEYYTRKASITADSEVNLDFSTFGPIPYTVPELKDELGL